VGPVVNYGCWPASISTGSSGVRRITRAKPG